MCCIYHLLLANLHVLENFTVVPVSLSTGSHTCPGLPTDIQQFIGNPKMFSFEISVCLACIPSSSTLRNGPKPSPLQGETVGLLKTLGTVPNQSPHPTVPWEGLTHEVLYVSHCTNGGNRWTGIIPIHPHLFCCLYCPSHPTVPLLQMDRLGSYQGIPLAPLCPYCQSYYHLARAHSAGCLLWFNTYHIKCYYNKSIYYRCENRLVVLTTKWLHGLFHHSESHSHTSVLVRFGFAFQEIGCSKLAIHFSRSPLCSHPLLC